MAASARVGLSRDGWRYSHSLHNREWTVEIDGNVVDSLSNGQAIEASIEAGHHVLRVKSMRFLLSPELPFDAAKDQVLRFSCQPRVRNPLQISRWMFWLVVSLFKHDSWIKLTATEVGDKPGKAAHRTSTSGPSTDAGRALASRQVVSDPSGLRVLAKQIGHESERGRNKGDAVLVVNELTKRFGERTAFSEVSFEVAHGEVFGFLGPNGAGKTTTVRTLGTLIAPTSGSAIVAGIPLNPMNGVEIRRSISIMPEAPGLYLRLTVSENLEYFAGLYGLHQPSSRINDALAAVNLADRAGDLCGSLSKGLRQRVGLARTLLSDPKIMFLDEPTSGLDPVAAREVHDLIVGLRERGVTIVLTTHRLDEAEKLCDRVAILNTTLRTVGTPAELRRQLFRSALLLRTVDPLNDPEQFFNKIDAVEDWSSEGSSYVLSVSDPKVAAPEVTRRLVAAGADVLSISEAEHSLEDVYLELVGDDVEDAPAMKNLDAMRIRAVARKEVRDYRRKRSIVATMIILPIVFLLEPVLSIFLAPGSQTTDLNHYVVLPLLYMLLIPVIIPSTLAAYTVVGEREQGTLEPLLTTPIRSLELILGKAAAVMLPSVMLSYAVFGIFLAAVGLFAHSAIASAVFNQGPVLLVLFLFAPLLAGWAIVVGLVISVRASEVRVAQQLGTLASFPPLSVIVLLATGAIHPTFPVAVLFAVGLLAVDVLALRIVLGAFDRERLVTGARAGRP